MLVTITKTQELSLLRNLQNTFKDTDSNMNDFFVYVTTTKVVLMLVDIFTLIVNDK